MRVLLVQGRRLNLRFLPAILRRQVENLLDLFIVPLAGFTFACAGAGAAGAGSLFLGAVAWDGFEEAGV